MNYLYDGRDLIDKRENQALLEIIGRLSQFGGLTMTAIIGKPVYD